MRSRRLAREPAGCEALLPGEVLPEQLLEASLTRDSDSDLFTHTGTVCVIIHSAELQTGGHNSNQTHTIVLFLFICVPLYCLAYSAFSY